MMERINAENVSHVNTYKPVLLPLLQCAPPSVWPLSMSTQGSTIRTRIWGPRHCSSSKNTPKKSAGA